jgi:prephenate dehydrogenase
VRRIVVWSRRPETRLQLREQPWVDEVADTPEAAVRSASLVVLAPPVDKIIDLARQIAPALPPGAIVTDVGSVKGDIARLGHAALRPDTSFVASHPMAGSDKTGWEHSKAELFEHRVCFITPLPESNPQAVELVAQFWHDLGSRVVSTSPDQHDEIAAHISHLPQVLASTLSAFLASKDHTWRNYAGGGLRDTTRIAASDPVMWRAIMEHNREEILRALREYQEELQGFISALANRDYLEISARMERAKAYRSRLQVPH